MTKQKHIPRRKERKQFLNRIKKLQDDNKFYREKAAKAEAAHCRLINVLQDVNGAFPDCGMLKEAPSYLRERLVEYRRLHEPIGRWDDMSNCHPASRFYDCFFYTIRGWMDTVIGKNTIDPIMVFKMANPIKGGVVTSIMISETVLSLENAREFYIREAVEHIVRGLITEFDKKAGRIGPHGVQMEGAT